MWPIKWVFIVVMLFVSRTAFSVRRSPNVDEWAVVPALSMIALFVLARDVFLLVRRQDSGNRDRGLRIASIVFLTAIVAVNTWAILATSGTD